MGNEKMILNKKAASSVIMLIFEMIVVILVIFITTSIAQSYGKSETIQKINAAEEFRMMLNTLAGVPGEATVFYPKNLSSFQLVLNSNNIIVSIKGEPENLWAVRSFSLPQGYTAQGVVQGEAQVCLEKKEKTLLLKKCS